MWADPVALVRYLYGRASLASVVTRGQMVAAGTRPWRALTLRTRFHTA